MMTEVAEIMVDEVTIVVVIDATVTAVDEIMAVAAEIEVDRQDGIIVAMIVMMVEGIYHKVPCLYNFQRLPRNECRNVSLLVSLSTFSSRLT